ncbi:L-histidine N(alpha)-methyltransferase [Pseudozobellia thermophila]|uniref:Dimethylhistidine N-methyltransferase n=1 Tax=Pseudozobellia thermophila TaxID=192903 RepID=A0A1M6MBZ1_9FLAO|nr:L-histidine N(alpha)-methyltransferase [Pseudozobellia thermophila]SHJ80996.1 dimethylhistidine N-methyltransferase [Pseudozobellia thermophila]
MQETIVHTNIQAQFERDVRQGLTDFPKHLSSKYFYDKKGDSLFKKIMHMPEYYLTDCEFDILSRYKSEIGALFASDKQAFKLIELGAGDGKKTKILLKHFTEQGLPFKYQPIDISQNILNELEKSLAKELPKLKVVPKQGTYFEALKEISDENGTRKVILFLGSNIGNLLHDQAIEFLKSVNELMKGDDLFFLGCDLKKNPQTILDAYNDPAGITEAFNKNILARINAELGGNFDLDNFLHWEVYDPESGTAKSFLVSKKAQTVTIAKLDLEVSFSPWETIHTEISQKYDDATVKWLAEQSGMEVCEEFTDKNSFYKNYVLRTLG